jgi:hypothetical protein
MQLAIFGKNFFTLALLACLALFDSSDLFSQTLEIEGVEERGIVYREVYHGGVTVHSAGFGINYRRGKNATGYSYKLLDFSFYGMRSPKEFKQFNPFFQNSNGYIYGKLNTLNIVRAGVGKLKELNSKGDKGGFAVGYSYFAGASFALLKPVYLEIFSPDAGINDPNLRTERYDPSKHFPDNIYGGAPFYRGLNETSISPGIYTTFNFNFEFGRSQQRLRMIEAGATLDLFAREAPIMAFEQNNNVFLTFHIRFLFGKRWNK